MSAGRRLDQHADDTAAKPDMTPMIDAVFLLIVFFLCIDFRTLEAKLPAHLPRDRGSSRAVETLVEQLPLRIVCDEVGVKQPRRPGRAAREPGRDAPFLRIGHRVHWQLGARPITDAGELAAHLGRIAADPTRRVADPTAPSGSKLLPVVVEPGPGATYGDVASTVDAVLAAGFDEVLFGGGRGR